MVVVQKLKERTHSEVVEVGDTAYKLAQAKKRDTGSRPGVMERGDKKTLPNASRRREGQEEIGDSTSLASPPLRL